MTRQIEYRTNRARVEARERSAGGGKILSGYAATFNSPSQDLGGFVEVLAPGCFQRSLIECDVRAFFNHNYDFLLARKESGTLRLFEDETGLGFELDCPETTLGRDLYELVRRGDIDGVSFGFYAASDEWSADGKTNTVLEAHPLVEISPVVFPAYLNGPRVEARSGDRFHSLNPERLARRPVPRISTPRISRTRALNLIRLDD